MLFYNARWYDPSLGRFAQADTIVPGGIQGYDRYAYANNNPVRYTDPSGHAARGDTDEAGCSFEGPACIMEMYGAYGDNDGMMDSLRHYVRRHKDYNPAADPELSDEGKAIVSIAMFHVAVQDTPPDASLWDILKATWPSAASLSIFGIITEGINMSHDDDGGGGGWSTGPNWTKKMLSESEVIAQGRNIREVDDLVRIYGGDVKGWKKMKGWDENGQEWHWYYHPDIGRVKVKSK